MRPRVVIDTNVVVSGILSANSYPSRIIDAWLGGQGFEPVMSSDLKEEIIEVLSRPKIKARLPKDPDLEVLLPLLFSKAILTRPKKIKQILFSDKRDHFLLELAISAKASSIVTGDSGLLSHSIKHCSLVSPKEFCETLDL